MTTTDATTKETGKPKSSLAAFMGAGGASTEGLRLCEKCRKGVVKCGGKCGFCGRKDATAEKAPVAAVASLCGQGGGEGDF